MISSEQTKNSNMQFTVIPRILFIYSVQKTSASNTMAKGHFRENTGATATAFHGSLFL